MKAEIKSAAGFAACLTLLAVLLGGCESKPSRTAVDVYADCLLAGPGLPKVDGNSAEDLQAVDRHIAHCGEYADAHHLGHVPACATDAECARVHGREY